jgi:hypothetical protein
MPETKRIGRRKGSSNRGDLFRTGRGWFAKDGRRFVPLVDAKGERLRKKDATGVKAAYDRWRSSRAIADEPVAPVGCWRFASASMTLSTSVCWSHWSAW